MKTHINLIPKHKRSRTTTENIKEVEPQQKCRFGTISNIKLLGGGGGGVKSILQAPNITLIVCDGSQHLVSCSGLVVNV